MKSGGGPSGRVALNLAPYPGVGVTEATALSRNPVHSEHVANAPPPLTAGRYTPPVGEAVRYRTLDVKRTETSVASIVAVGTQDAADRLAILEIVNRYGRAVDEQDNDLYRTCFWSDAELVAGRKTMRGEEFLDQTRFKAELPLRAITGAGGEAGIDTLQTSTHAMGGTTIDITDDRADTETTCVAFLVGPRDGELTMLVRGIAYTDIFERRDGLWRIFRRTHSFRWMFEAKVTKVVGMTI